MLLTNYLNLHDRTTNLSPKSTQVADMGVIQLHACKASYEGSRNDDRECHGN